MKPLPEDFKEMLYEMLGNEAALLIEALDKAPVTSVRVNRRKPVTEFENTSPVTWCKSGFYLEERPEFIFDPLLHAGAYYVQDASSMIYETVAEILYDKFKEINRENGKVSNPAIKVLDLCAAPGGKTTAMINALPDGCEITANEYSSKRVSALKENIERWGYPHVIVTNKDTGFYAGQGEVFDIVAVDAPCSGEGMMRKEEVARTQWNRAFVCQCAALQREILKNAVECLKPGGFLIYSTCTFNREENESNVDYITQELKLESIDLEFPKDWKIPGGINTDKPVYRFMPHKTKGEGLFLAVFRKNGNWEESPAKKPNTHKKDRDDSSSPENLPMVNVDKDTALAYLRRESLRLPEGAPLGMVTISYKDLPLGPAKNIGSRANNLYPKHKRILKR